MEKILVVDDHKQNCEILEDILSSWGFQVFKAFHGMEAIDSVSRYKPDIVLLDVMLPGMNGFEVCKKIKHQPETQNLPVIMLTVLNDVEDRIQGYTVGADMFLSKPVNYKELKSMIMVLLNKKKEMKKMVSHMQVVESFLELMKLVNSPLYFHSCRVKEYCEKVGHILDITDENLNELIIGAYLHDIGKMITGEAENHVENGLTIIRPLHFAPGINELVYHHHERSDGEGYPNHLHGRQIPLGLQIISAVDQFVGKWERLDDEEKALSALEAESQQCYWSTNVVEAIRQVYEDKKFLENFTVTQ